MPATPHSRSARLTVAIACIGFFVTVLDSTAVNVALPTIGARLGAGMSGLQWVVDAYVLMFAALLLSAGAISDRVGADRAFGIGLGVFTLTSAACGLAPDLMVLVAARVVQGGAAAVMLPASLSLVRQAFPDAAARARGIAWWTAGGGAAIAAGPVVGGALTDVLGWRAIFFVNLPAGLLGLAGLFGLFRAPRSRPEPPDEPATLDVAGQLSSVLAVTALTFAVIEGGGPSGLGASSAVAWVVFAVAGAAFGWIETHTRHPAVPPSLFRSPTVLVCTATGFAQNFASYGTVFLLSLFFQDQRGASPTVAGLMFLPMTALVLAANILAGRLVGRFGPRPPMVAGQLVQAASLLGLLSVGAHSPTVLVLVLLVPLGLGGGITVPPMTAALLEAVEPERSGVAAGVLSASRQLGGAIGVAAFGGLVPDPAHFQSGMRLSLVIGAGVLLTTAVAGMLPPRPGAARVAAGASQVRLRG